MRHAFRTVCFVTAFAGVSLVFLGARVSGQPAFKLKFNPADSFDTIIWLNAEYKKCQIPGNDFATAKNVKEFEKSLQSLKGKELRWPLAIKSIDQDSVLTIAVDTVGFATVTVKTPKSKGLNTYDVAGESWLDKAKQKDRVVFTGKIQAVEMGKDFDGVVTFTFILDKQSLEHRPYTPKP